MNQSNGNSRNKNNGNSGGGNNSGNNSGGGNHNGSNNNGGGGNNSGNNNGGGGTSSRKRKKSRKKPRLEPLKYWGDAGALPVRSDYVLTSDDPTTVIRSLGKAPIPGKNSAPELYFEVLYKRAAGLAQALAIAGNLNSEADDAPPASATD